MRSAEAVAAILAIGLAVSVSVNVLQNNLNAQLCANISYYNKPLVLDSYSIAEDAISLVLWNQGADEIHLIPICNINGWKPNSFNQSASTVPPDGTVVVTINGPIECNNATYDIDMPYYIGSNDYPLNITQFTFTATIPHGAVVYEPAVTAEQAIAAGREFLDTRNVTTGQMLSMSLTVLEPNNYWHGMFGIPNDAQLGFQHCWIIKFEKACCPGHFFQVFVNCETGDVIGGIQCR